MAVPGAPVFGPGAGDSTSAQVVDLRHARADRSRTGPSPTGAADSRLVRLFEFEAALRRCETVKALAYRLVNGVLPVVGASQAAIVERRGNKLDLTLVSSLAQIDRKAPLALWLQVALRNACYSDAGDGKPAESQLDASTAPGAPYPFSHAVALPLTDRRTGKAFAYLCLLSPSPIPAENAALAGRIADTASHAWLAHGGGVSPARWRPGRKALAISAAALLAAMMIPVPLTILSPAEVTPFGPAVISAPLAGVIKTIRVTPNEKVAPGQLLVELDTTELRNRSEIAGKTKIVAAARLRRIEQDSLRGVEGARELVTARSELALAEAEQAFALEMLTLSQIRAPGPGLAVFADREALTGKPVSTGERIMKIADPARTWLRIDVSVADSIALGEARHGRLFLDANPLDPVAFEVESASYLATQNAEGHLAYSVFARWRDASSPAPRIGLRGIAQLSGSRIPLGFFLFRRPLSALRQWTGL